MRNLRESFPLFIPEYYPSEINYQPLSITKDMHLQGGIKKGKAAFSIGLIKKMAKESQIETV